MRVLYLDIETYSSASLPKCGVYRYCDSPDFEILLLSYAFDDGPVMTIDLTCGEQLPAEFLKALEDPSILKIAHNAAFERVCFSKFLGHWLDPSQWRCTMVMAWYSTLPGRLADATVALNVTEKKMEEGKDLIPFRFDTFRMDAMRAILRHGFERRQCHTTAGVHAFADRPDDIAANRADIEMALLQVRRAVAVFDMFSGKQLRYGY